MSTRDYPAPSLVVLIGPPGAGKTTWLENNLPDAVRVDLEEMRRNPDADRDALVTAAIDKTFSELRDNHVVVFDSTAINGAFRARLRGIAEHVNAPAYAVVFDVPLDDLLDAQISRKYPVPAERVRELYDQFRNQINDIYAEPWAATDTVTRTAEDRALTDTTPPTDDADAEERALDVVVQICVSDEPELEEGDTENDAKATDETTAPIAEDAGNMVERAFSPARIQYRASGAGKQYRVIQGYISRTNTLSEDLGGFREIIAPGAFRSALRNDDGSPKDIRLLYSHNVEAVLARTGVNMELKEDDMGLRMWARVDMSDPDVARVASKMEQGLVDAASFGFTVAEDTWADGSAYPIRTIRQIDTLFEVTVCSWPAYPATRLAIMDDAIRSGRLPTGGAARTAPEMVGVSSRDALSGTGTRSAAAWQARLSLRKTHSKRYLP